MLHNQFPRKSRAMLGVALAAGGLLTASCSSEGSSKTTSAAASTAPSPSELAPASTSPATEAQSAPTPAPNTIGSAAVAKVCDGFFVHIQPDGTARLVGRPVIDTHGNAMEAEANPAGTLFTAMKDMPDYVTGKDSWLDLKGHPANTATICHDASVSSRQMLQPNGYRRWVATTHPQEYDHPTPGKTNIEFPLDATSLNPNGTGVVGLDFGPDGLYGVCADLENANPHLTSCPTG